MGRPLGKTACIPCATACKLPKYRTSDLPKLRRKYHTGQTITVIDVNGNGEESHEPEARVRRLVVDRKYRFHVGCLDKHGVRESFTYIELEQRAR